MAKKNLDQRLKDLHRKLKQQVRSQKARNAALDRKLADLDKVTRALLRKVKAHRAKAKRRKR